MPKRADQPTKPPLQLKEPRDAVRSKIQDRITKGAQLKAMNVSSANQLETFDKEYRKWNDYNEALLDALFTNDSPKTDYRWSVSGGLILGEESAFDRYRRQLRFLDELCQALESLLERLELIPLAPGVAVPATHVVESPTAAAWELLHENVKAVAGKRFEDGHYADSVEAAFKALNNDVKAIARSRGVSDSDGATLMHTVFSPNRPVIVLADLSTQTGKDMQQGYMEIFAGAMSAIRNPKAHDNIEISAERALHLLFVASTLWYTLDARL